MKGLVIAARWTVRVTFVIQLVLGTALWTGRFDQVRPVHIASGILLILSLWMLAAFYWVIDMRGYRRWAFPLVVVGMNSIAMYCMAQLLKGWTRRTLETHFGANLFSGVYWPIFAAAAVLFVCWLVCLWMYRRKIFRRI